MDSHQTPGLYLRRAPPIAVMVPWVAINVWYLAMAIDPTALLAVQAAHALQYLIFPTRVLINRARREPSAPAEPDWRVAAFSLVSWMVVGTAVFEGMEPLFRLGYGLGGGRGATPGVVASILISAIGIHHYFIDGALYKLRNPEVRRDLFAHLSA